MKKFIFLINLLSGSLAFSQPAFDLSFAEVTNDGSTYTVDVLLSFSSSATLASSNLVFTFNDAALSNPTYVANSTQLDAPPTYLVSVTNPATGRASVNIVQSASGFGTTITSMPIVIATITFTTTDPAGSSMLNWVYDGDGASTGIVVFQDNGSNSTTQLNANMLSNLNTFTLPVELAYFKAQHTDRKTVDLHWTTLSETNNSHFEVERSATGKDFIQVGKVAGSGTVVERRDYHFEDKQPQQGINYYRLRQVDWDGTFSYSEIQAVHFTAPKTTIIRVFPNPAREVLSYQLEGIEQLKRIQLFNNSGKLLRETNLIDGQFSLQGLPDGSYFLIFQTSSEKHHQQVIKQNGN